jgi:Asp-tRNA(Asn)/Glu-tRNA(Gln) amidotransferase A subunit family amidase
MHRLSLKQLVVALESGQTNLQDYLTALTQRSEQVAPELNCMINAAPPAVIM